MLWLVALLFLVGFESPLSFFCIINLVVGLA